MPRISLSEAIRLGTMLRPQTFGGAALDAIGLKMSKVGLKGWEAGVATYSDARQEWPILGMRHKGGCPAGCKVEHLVDVGSIIVHLNDDHRWTREQIGNWVAAIEVPGVVTSEVEVIPCHV